ncbi:hypothetical protein CHLRE_10g428400v5 [Chlamydomonas reinhardtii]|uniref:Pseudouridine synthase RsuA/RluA-like domain-containing protein n=1 Tax=Chlamydomonas reinhardtii TaxID=3055 RepID=A0A2K3D9P1_CHLRE|nr:uncharacterized protein CHLRE_10g428400v5 [Chlamydomonas reinhardtii]PNW77243.1 hypothetical protein CHLRE_10g428400v5 [Chlamydomonas reinhardtii]
MARYLASRAWASSAAACTGLGGAEAAVGPGVWALLGLAGGASPSWRCIASQTPQAAAQQDKEQQHQEEPLSRHEAAPQPAQKRAGVPGASSSLRDDVAYGSIGGRVRSRPAVADTRTPDTASTAGSASTSAPDSSREGSSSAASSINSSSSSSSGSSPAGSRSTKSAVRGADILHRFREEGFAATPPVSFIRGMPAPTAMSWLRRRGPEVPHAVLYRLFRQRQVRLYDGDKVVRVRGCRQLANGEQLLFPASLRPAAEAGAGPGGGLMEAAGAGARDAAAAGRAASHGEAGPGPGSRAGSAGVVVGAGAAVTAAGVTAAVAQRSTLFKPAGGAAATAAVGGAGGGSNSGSSSSRGGSSGLLTPQLLTPERVRRWVLGVQPGLVFINKPAGVRVHGRAAGDVDSAGGRDGGGPTLDSVMGEALRFGEQDEPKLVHRLDAQASGVMVVARNADAAAWLSAAFRGKSRQALAEEEGEQGEDARGGGRGRGRGRQDPRGRQGRGRDADDIPEDLYVARTYWAFLAGDLQPRQSGRIRFPVAVDGSFYPAVSSYRVRGTGCGVTWVELTPETGRRHQLRIHCARKLGAPIIGDGRYGYGGLPPRLGLRDRLPPEWWALLGEDPRVVALRLQQQAAEQAEAEVEAGAAVAGAGSGGARAGRGGRGRSASPGAARAAVPSVPIMLHARELVIKRPGKSPLVAVAPLPRYVRELMEAAGWPLPRDG